MINSQEHQSLLKYLFHSRLNIHFYFMYELNRKVNIQFQITRERYFFPVKITITSRTYSTSLIQVHKFSSLLINYYYYYYYFQILHQNIIGDNQEQAKNAMTALTTQHYLLPKHQKSEDKEGRLYMLWYFLSCTTRKFVHPNSTFHLLQNRRF